MYQHFSSLSLEELKQGYRYDAPARSYICLQCGQSFSEDEIHPQGQRLLTAMAAVRQHLRDQHREPLSELLSLERKVTGLTDHQRALCMLLAQGLSDKEIGEQTGVAATTIRHQRFVLRERAKVARVQLAIFELLDEAMQEKRQPDPKEELIMTPSNPNLVDDRYFVTVEEEEKIIKAAFSSHDPLRLKHIPRKEKRKVVILRLIASQFEAGRTYSEKEVNAVLQDIHADFAAIRRYLIDYGHLKRTPDGSSYWLAERDASE